MGYINRYISRDYLTNNPSWDIEDSVWKAEKIAALLSNAGVLPGSMAEVGCGAGGVLAEMRRYFPHADLFGYDIAPDAARFWGRHASKNICFEVGDFFTLSRRRYETILILDVIEHLQDPFSFLSKLRDYADAFVFHFPLDLSALNVLREKPLLFSRQKVGHIHYFSKTIALEVLRECAYKVHDWCYTGAAFSSPQRNWKTLLASLPRRLAYAVDKDWGVRLLGGETLMVLAKATE